MTPMKPSSISPVGDWNSNEAAWSDVRYTVKAKGAQFLVSAIDTYSGEQARVSEIVWDGVSLSFIERWPADRVSRCTIRMISADSAEMSHAYTDQFTLVRANTFMAEAA